MNIKTINSHLYDNIQRSHNKKTKSKKVSTSKHNKHEQQFTELNTWCTWIRLKKTSTTDSYGIGVSEGLSTMGIFVSAIRPNSPADLSGKLYLYDRILMTIELRSNDPNLSTDETTNIFKLDCLN
ncbi:unnamed protein product [Schistosoma mattheei]|uniref:Uncharacterized protein n=1 Tax=Schistosoma mattheei TaxID=31246 RepID=A0A183Q5K9_9TREM|nr:unnamed protein product [Schistosoma mattheei]